ncbi:hypothetical protein MN608_03116 [Microdochium nivale]|nr:hypothetical protein MN608_03116 [Microdochium nivale]
MQVKQPQKRTRGKSSRTTPPAQAETGSENLPPAMTSPGIERPLLEVVVDQFLVTAYKRLEECDFYYCPSTTATKKATNKATNKACGNHNSKEDIETARALHNQFSKAGRNWEPKKFVVNIARFLKLVHCHHHKLSAYIKLAEWKAAQGLSGSVERVEYDANDKIEYEPSGSNSSSSSSRSSIDTESAGHALCTEHPVKSEHGQEHGSADTTLSDCHRSVDSGSDSGIGKDARLSSGSNHSQMVGGSASSDGWTPGTTSAADIETQMSALAVAGEEVPVLDLRSAANDQILEPSIEASEHDTVKSGTPPPVPISPIDLLVPIITAPHPTINMPESRLDIAVSAIDVVVGCVCQPAPTESGSPTDLRQSVDRVLGEFATHALAADGAASMTYPAATSTFDVAHSDRSRRLSFAQSSAQRALWCAVESRATRSDNATGIVYIRKYEDMDGILHIGWTCGMCNYSGPGCYLTKTSWLWDSGGEVFGASRIVAIMAAQLAAYRREGIRCSLSPSCKLSPHDEWFQVGEEFATRLLKSWVWFFQRPAHNAHGELIGPRLAAWSRIVGDVGENASAAASAERLGSTGSSRARSQSHLSVDYNESAATSFEHIIEKIGSPQSGNASVNQGDEFRPRSSSSSIKSWWTADRSEFFPRPRRAFSGRADESKDCQELHDLIRAWQMLDPASSGEDFLRMWDTTPTKKKSRPSFGGLIPPKFRRSVGGS